MEIKHFSHDHPLTLSEGGEKLDDDRKSYLCKICGLPILSSPSYSCSNIINNGGCNFFMHKPCAQLPQELNHPRHRPDYFTPHPLSLRPNHDYSIFTYCCSECDFELHPLLARTVEIKTDHESHPQHPLVAICKDTLARCDACGEEQKGFFFACISQDCNFWIHQDCTVLPSMLTHISEYDSRPDPFILTYNLSDLYQQIPYTRCTFCNGHLVSEGVYFCVHDQSFAHLNCASSRMEKLTSETSAELTLLPDEGDTFPSLVIRAIRQTQIVPNRWMKYSVEKFHYHPLVKDDHKACSLVQELELELLVCDACLQPISSSDPFYRCTQPDCNFIIHNSCAHLPLMIYYNIIGDVSEGEMAIYMIKTPLCNLRKDFFNLSPCFLCHRPCNGFGYFFQNNNFIADVECASSPDIIKHALHKHHLLFKTYPSNNMLYACCSNKSASYLVYRCVSCDFMIHVGCALLPKKTRHKFDKHPLELTTSHLSKQLLDDCFCEFCEKDIDQQYWFYRCAKCDQCFHINCIPSVGYLSKVKFGTSLDISRHHHHPLTLTRMLIEGRQRCGSCKHIIDGFEDNMAFHCSKCHFWICFSCATDNYDANVVDKSRLHFYHLSLENMEI